MTDLERFFRRLVTNLAASDPARLHRPLSLSDIQHSIIPYRANRRALGLDSSEDYELLLLRLASGEGGFVRTEPEEARVAFAQEAGKLHPDLDVLHRFEDVLLTLRSAPLERALHAASGSHDGMPAVSASLPPQERPALDLAAIELPEVELPADVQPEDFSSAEEASFEAEEAFADESAEGPICLYCGGSLPINRTVNFCPHCGQSQTVPLCPACHSELEPGWRHCVNCGAAVVDR